MRASLPFFEDVDARVLAVLVEVVDVRRHHGTVRLPRHLPVGDVRRVADVRDVEAVAVIDRRRGEDIVLRGPVGRDELKAHAALRVVAVRCPRERAVRAGHLHRLHLHAVCLVHAVVLTNKRALRRRRQHTRQRHRAARRHSLFKHSFPPSYFPFARLYHK